METNLHLTDGLPAGRRHDFQRGHHVDVQLHIRPVHAETLQKRQDMRRDVLRSPELIHGEGHLRLAVVVLELHMTIAAVLEAQCLFRSHRCAA